MSRPGALAAKHVLTLIACIVLLPCAVMGAESAVTAHFYLQKDTYGVGEPVFLYLEFQNRGKTPVWYDGTLGCGLGMTFQVTAAKRPTPGWPHVALTCFFGYGTSGPDCFSLGPTELRPGAKRTWRELVNGPYLLNNPGTYTISAHESIGWSHSRNPRSGSDLNVTGKFTIAADYEGEQELKDAFAPLVNQLSSPKAVARWQAISAITDLAPPFLESTIIGLSRNRETVSFAIPALRRLGTPAALARLVTLASQGNEYATEQLALTRDKAYLPFFKKLISQATLKDRTTAIDAAGLLGGKDAVQLLTPLLSDRTEFIREAAIDGLVRADCREAVAPLISALVDPGPDVREMARLALAQLTHRSATTESSIFDGAQKRMQGCGEGSTDAGLSHPGLPPRQVYLRWLNWWSLNGSTALIYGPHQCGITRPLN